MYGLPASTAINKPLYKKAVFEKFNLKTAERERFDADISKMALVARISPATVPALKEGQEVKIIYVLQIQLKRKEFDVKNILLLQKLIPQRMLFALENAHETQLTVIIDSHILTSKWNPTDDVTILLDGLNLDTVWGNIVMHVGNLQTERGDTLHDKVQNQAKRELIIRQIDTLKKQLVKCVQSRKKYELHQQILILKEQL